MAPQLLIAGHIVRDLTPEGWRPGGGALYAAAQAARLGIDVAVVTACQPEIEPEALVPSVEWRQVPGREGIVFDNVYSDGARSQRLLGSGQALTYEDIPSDWLDTPLVLLTPVFHDVDESLPAKLLKAGRIVGLGAQGWLRRVVEERVTRGEVETRPAWLHGDVVFVSEEDVAEPEAVAVWRKYVGIVVLTRAEEGCSVWDATGRHNVAPVPTREVDPTGAGDVFATAFLVRYGETSDAVESAHFAAAAAALAIRGEGVDGVATRGEIEARLAVDAQAGSA